MAVYNAVSGYLHKIDKRAELISKVVGCEFFEKFGAPLIYDCHLRYSPTADGLSSLDKNIISWNQWVFAPIPNYKYFYCRGHLFEQTHSRCDRSIPSRDYMSCCYEWHNLYLSEDAKEL